MQSLADKVVAIRSLLPLLFAHRDFIAGGVQVDLAQWVSEPSPLDGPPPPPPMWNLGCDGHCHTCWMQQELTGKAVKCPPEERWVRIYHGLRSRYRIRDLEEALLGLADYDVDWAQAVWAVFVEAPDGERCDPEHPELGMKTEAISQETREERARYANDGLWWLASEIEGDVKGEGDRLPTKEQQCADLMREGILSPSVIGQRLGCSTRHAKRLKATVKVRWGSALYAVRA